MSGTKNKSRHNIADPFELGKEVIHTAQQKAVKDAQINAKIFLSQLLGINTGESAGESSETTTHNNEAETADGNIIEVFNIAKLQASESKKHTAQAEKAPPVHKEAAIDYHGDILRSREKASHMEKREIQQSVEQIKVELSRLVSSSKLLKMEFSSTTMEQQTENVGQYDLSFFDWMLTVIRSARQKVEDSRTWMGTVKGKGAKKGYWGMFKKHGTTFGLSGERAVATQVG